MNLFLRLPGIVCLFVFTFLFSGAYSQKTPQQIQELKQRVLSDPKVASVEISAQRHTPSFIGLRRYQKVSKEQARLALSNYLGVRNGVDELVWNREVPLDNRMEVQEFKQSYRGLKVEHSRFTSFVKDGNVLFFNGAFFEVPQSLPTKPRISEAQALDYAKARINAKKYAWEAVEENIRAVASLGTKAALHLELLEYLPKGELVVVRNFNREDIAEMRLAYKFNIYAFEPVSRAWVFVDAMNGEILLVDKIIKHVDEDAPATSLPVTVQTRYAGARTIYTKQVSGADPNSGQTLVASNPLEVYSAGGLTNVLVDDTKGGGIETYDLNAVGGLPVSLTPAYTLAKSFTDVDNAWTLPEHQRGNTIPTAPVEAENDDIAWDAHWGASVVYDYWLAKHARKSFDGNNAKIKSYIHSGLAYDNAFWNGKAMTYGDGSYPAKANGFKPLTSLDVCGHEIGHGVCEFTADLVYAKESGAMNEGFSDIWAACVEYYVIKNVDPTLANVYKPFYIGEQITANPAIPLRRMDKPKARNNPDTYRGERWTNQFGCTPTLANDQCGVHNNSGVLNKWFYLLTVGSGAGSGPDVAFVGEDDGINDAVTTGPLEGQRPANTYSVTGLGFNVSEKITYMTELLLSTTATFDEARRVSIQVATDISGSPCSDMVKSVTNSWYAVGVGAEFTEPCKITYGFITQPGSSVSEAQGGAGCMAEYEVKIPVLLPAGSTATVSASGTANSSLDYRLTTTTLSNSGTTVVSSPISVFIKNDGVVEGDEYIDLTITVTNVGANSLNDKYRLNIIEDDVIPVIGTQSKTLLDANFNAELNGYNSPSNWREIIGAEGTGPTGENYNKWGVWDGQLMVTGKVDAAGPDLPSGNYNNNSPSNTIILSPLIDARGLSNLNFKFDFRVQGEIDPNGADIEAWGKYDYMSVVYSFDGITFYELTVQEGFGQFASALPNEGVFEGVLPSYLNNKTFYIGFKWYNDTNAGGPESVKIDNITLKGAPRKIENELASNSSEQLNPSQHVYYYSVQDGEIIANIKNSSTKNFGCTNLKIAKAGNATSVMDLGSSGKVTVADKTVGVGTEFSNTKSPTTITLYYTEDQIKALEDASRVSRTSFSIYQTNASDYTLATGVNTQKFTTTYSAIAGVGGTFSITVSNKLGGSFYRVGVQPGGKKGGGPIQSSVMENNNEVLKTFSIGLIYPNPARGESFIQLITPREYNLRLEVVNVLGQLMFVQSEKINSGRSQIRLQSAKLKSGSYLLRIKDEKGEILDSQTFLKE